MYKRLKTDNNAGQIIANIETEESFSAIAIRVTGTTPGTTPTQLNGSNMGRFRMWKRGEPKVDILIDWARFYNNWMGGAPTATFPAGATAAVEYAVIIPRSFPGEGNVDLVTPADRCRLELQLSGVTVGASSAHFVSAPSVVFELMPAKGMHLYDLTMLESQYSLAANQNFVTTLQGDNISQIFISEVPGTPAAGGGALSLKGATPTTTLQNGSVVLNIDGDNYNFDVAEAISHGYNIYQIETSSADIAPVYDSILIGLQQGNGLADNLDFQVKAGGSASILSVLVCGRRMSRTNRDLSIRKVESYKLAVSSRKEAQGRTTAKEGLTLAGAL